MITQTWKKPMTKRIPLLFSFLMAALMAAGQNPAETSKLDSLVQTLGKGLMDQPQSVGLSIGVYHRGAKYFYNFGTVEKGKNQKPSENTLYEIGSITKTFASLILAKAALEKKVKPEDDIRKYLSGEYPNLQFEGHPIQLVHLANTTAGIPEWVPAEPEILKKAHADSVALLREKIYGKFTREDFFKGLREIKLDTIPGTKRRHSNGGAQLLTYILENVYQQPFEQLVEEYILKPNKMDQSKFVVPASLTAQMAKGYNENGKLTPPGFTSPYFRGIAGLKSGTADLLKYIQLMLDDQNAMTARAIQRTINVDISTSKISIAEPGGVIKPDFFSVGMNWFLYQYEKGKTQVWTDGGTSGFNSYLIFYPESKIGIVVLANKSDEKTFGALPGIAYQICQWLVSQK
jgi:D-alanyl-D-alanine-carboxypeptidase/D-alanyl-D-alanine-endopeptidase